MRQLILLVSILSLALLSSALATGCGGSIITYEQETLSVTGTAAFDGTLEMEGSEVSVAEVSQAEGSLTLEQTGKTCFRVRGANLCATNYGSFEFRVTDGNQLQLRGCGSLFGVEPECLDWTNIDLDLPDESNHESESRPASTANHVSQLE